MQSVAKNHGSNGRTITKKSIPMNNREDRTEAMRSDRGKGKNQLQWGAAKLDTYALCVKTGFRNSTHDQLDALPTAPTRKLTYPNSRHRLLHVKDLG